MARPVFTRSPTSPLIIINAQNEPLILPRDIYFRRGFCFDCHKPYVWRARGLEPGTALTEEEFENKSRAQSLWLHYTKKGVGPCCVPDADRQFIALNAKAVTYHI